MENKNLKSDIDMAHFRFALIAPVIQGIFPDASKAAYYRRVTENPLTLPCGSVFHYDSKTLSKWESFYKRGGMDALMPKVRSDSGSTRVLPDSAIAEIFRFREKYPRLNATQVYFRLIEEGFISADVSVSSVQRFIKRHDLKSARNLNVKDRKAFEEEFFGGMWQADTCYMPYITENGRKHRTYLIMIVDDHSRMIVGGRIFLNDNAYNFQQVFKDAVSAYGIPNKLYIDHGSPYSNEQLTLICGCLGTHKLHSPVRDGASKGKVERNFRTLKERWLYGLDFTQIPSLESFNEKLSSYIRTHNTSLHSATGTTPLDRFMKTNNHVKKPKSPEWLSECFMNRLTRKVNNDSTVSVDGIYYDAPMQFIRMKVEIRFLPGDMGNAYIYYEDEHYPLRKTDKIANGKTKRNNYLSIDYEAEYLTV